MRQIKQLFRIIYVLYRIKLLSPIGWFRLLHAIYKYGINLMALLSFAEKYYAENTALVDDQETLNYQQLLSQSEMLAIALKEEFLLGNGKKVAILCRNHVTFVKSIFAVAQSGADIYLLNPEMSQGQISYLLEHNDFALLIYDSEWHSHIEGISYHGAKILSHHEHLLAVNNIIQVKENMKREKDGWKIERSSSSKLVLLTGGTTGRSKEASHKPSVFNYLNPFLALLIRLNLINYHTAYVATPIYHGYGVALILLFAAMGKKIVITHRFDAKKACSLIREHQVEVVSVVPLMLNKMLKQSVEDLRSITRILSGGAELNPKLVKETFYYLGDVLCNLYGTSETGLNMIATPIDLQYSVKTIGKKISGVQLKIMDNQKVEVKDGAVGHFYVSNRWSIKSSSHYWIGTGDLGYKDEKGFYFLRGRVDDMVVSAGENVYPMDLEQILRIHPQIEDVAVIGITDEDFGQRLKVFVVLTSNSTITKEELFEWLRSKVARFQIPKEIVFLDQMPYTPLGKLDRKKLK